MANYSVNITDGAGSQSMKAGNYSVTVTATGYDPSTLAPSTFTAGETSGSGAFTLSANGALTLVFNETGASGGTPVTSGSVVMTDSTGTTRYGSPVNIGATGEADFPNVPFDSTTPYELYFVQLSTDDAHNVFGGVISVSMSSATQQEYVVNTPIAEQSFTLTDANYSGLPIAAATLTFAGE